MSNEIMTVGILRLSGTGSNHIHLEDYIYSEEGVAPTLAARDYKDPRRILIRRKHERDNHSRQP